MTSYTQADFDDLVRALRRFADEDLDQFAHFRLKTRHGELFVELTRELSPDRPTELYPLYDESGSGE